MLTLNKYLSLKYQSTYLKWLVLKNNYFKFDLMIKQQVSGTAIGTKFAPPYACIFMDRVETEFLEKEHLKQQIWLRYIDDIFFVCTYGEDELVSFLNV